MTRVALAMTLAVPLFGCSDHVHEGNAPDGAAGPPSGITMTEWGGRLFTGRGCVGCHTLRNRSVGGPISEFFVSPRRLADGRDVSADEAYLRRAILKPNADVVAGYEPVMPSYEGLLEPREVDALIAFLMAQQ